MANFKRTCRWDRTKFSLGLFQPVIICVLSKSVIIKFMTPPPCILSSYVEILASLQRTLDLAPFVPLFLTFIVLIAKVHTFAP